MVSSKSQALLETPSGHLQISSLSHESTLNNAGDNASETSCQIQLSLILPTFNEVRNINNISDYSGLNLLMFPRVSHRLSSYTVAILAVTL
jgi:hypothetical protein